jgi:DNA-3-methyladenine glycosylase II
MRGMSDVSVGSQPTVLPAVAPFNLACSLRALSGFSPCAVDQLVHNGAVRKALAHPSDPSRAVVVEVGPPPDPSFCGVSLVVYAEAALTAAELSRVELAVDRWLGLSEDHTAFLALARADPAMRRLLAVAEGLHQVRFASLAEGAVFFTLTQRSTQWFAAGRKRRLAAERGPRLTVGDVSYVGFPALDELVQWTVADLVPYAGSRHRAERLYEVLAGLSVLDEEWLRTGDYDAVRDVLLAIKGVGAFTAHALLLRVLGRPDDVPLELAQFTRVAEQVYGEPVPSPAEIRRRYGPWVGWWAYLSRTAQPWLPEADATLTAVAHLSDAVSLAAPPRPTDGFIAATLATDQPTPPAEPWPPSPHLGPVAAAHAAV